MIGHAPQPDYQSRVSSSQVGGGNPKPFGQERFITKLTATSDECGQVLRELQGKLEGLQQKMISAQMMVATSEDTIKTTAEQLLA